jgi:hypothetical protein
MLIIVLKNYVNVNGNVNANENNKNVNGNANCLKPLKKKNIK